MAQKLRNYVPPAETEEGKKYRLRLEASREWLKDYQERRREETKAEPQEERAE